MFDPALQTAIQQLKPPLLEMWTRYFSLGGNHPLVYHRA